MSILGGLLNPLGERDPTLFHYLLSETRKGNRKLFDETVEQLWTKKEDVPKGEQAVRRYFFVEANPRHFKRGELEKLALPYAVTAHESKGYKANLLKPFFELPVKYDRDADYHKGVLSEGMKRLKFEQLMMGDILIVRGGHLVDFVKAKDARKIQRLLKKVVYPVKKEQP